MVMQRRTEQRRTDQEQIWNPRTRLGSLVQSGKVTSLSQLFENG